MRKAMEEEARICQATDQAKCQCIKMSIQNVNALKLILKLHCVHRYVMNDQNYGITKCSSSPSC